MSSHFSVHQVIEPVVTGNRGFELDAVICQCRKVRLTAFDFSCVLVLISPLKKLMETQMQGKISMDLSFCQS